MFKKLLVLSLAMVLTKVSANACTGITLKTENNETIQGRTIEWSKNNLKSKLIISPRGVDYQSYMPNGKIGNKWKGKYGFVGVSVEHDSLIGEGVNEKGLNAGVFFFLNYGSLAPFTGENLEKSINDMDVVKWILTNFATVDEVKQAIAQVNIVPIMIKDGVASPTGHWRVTDATGKSIVIEIVNKGQVRIYDNTVGVLTNSPSFDWQLTNLNNYINMHSGTNQPFKLGNQNVFAFGAGSGFWGLPGDMTPPSRFVRAAFYANNTPAMKNNDEGVSQAFHILNNFDIPIGITYTDKKVIPQDLSSATQWTTVINLVEKKFYYKTMFNQNIRMVDLEKIDFSKVKPQALPLDKDKVQPVDELIIK